MQLELKSFQRLIERDIVADMIAEPLTKVQPDDSAQMISTMMLKRGFDECGVVRYGSVTEIVRRCDLGGGIVADHARPVLIGRLVSGSAPLWECLDKFRETTPLYLLGKDGIDRIVTRADLLKQPARLMMFGIVSLMEMAMLELIQRHHPGETWSASLNKNRMSDAKKLHTKRRKANEEIDLADCLQFCDKGDICLKSADISGGWKHSKRKLKNLLGSLQKIRDDLAHSQPTIAGSDWDKTFTALQDGHLLLQRMVDQLGEEVAVPAPAL